MGKRGFDITRYRLDSNGTLYRNDSEPGGIQIWNKANSSEIKRYWKEQRGTAKRANKSTTIRSIDRKYSTQFVKGSYKSKNGSVKGSFKPLAIKSGANAEYVWRRASYIDGNGNIARDSSKRQWGADATKFKKKNIGKTQIGKGYVLNGGADWMRHLQISAHQAMINSEHFRIAVGYRAQKVFRDSIKYQKFWSSNSTTWRPLASYTLKKRAKRGTGTRILNEYGDLLNSIKVEERDGALTTKVYTDIVAANASHHKKYSICYAGYHNDPRPGDTYGKGFGGRSPKPYIRRQFMGHSDKIDTFAFSIMKRYLFDDVFLIQKV